MSDNIVDIESLDLEGRGIAHLKNEDGTAGKTIFVEQALPGERVSFQSFRKKERWEVATMTVLHREASWRVAPKCPYFGLCGGCAMQHLDASAQVAMKQRVLEDTLAHIGKVRPDRMLPPIHGPSWHYRYRARLSVRHVRKKDTVLVGFHEKKSRYITDMQSCEILPQQVSDLLMPLRTLIGSLSIVESVPQIELAIGQDIIALVLRILLPLEKTDEAKLQAFADQHQIHWWLQPKGPDTAYPYYPAASDLYYCLPEFSVTLPFRPTDFTQVNHAINQVLVSRALRLLAVQPHERILDLFCGMGNFTLPLATQAREVVGIEGSTTLVERARQNAVSNGLGEKTQFLCRNLFEINAKDFALLGKFDRLLIDPPREGAMEFCNALAELHNNAVASIHPKRIVYVSCNPATLARDAGLLVNNAGYTLTHAGIINMFPHTAHVESLAVFERSDTVL